MTEPLYAQVEQAHKLGPIAVRATTKHGSAVFPLAVFIKLVANRGAGKLLYHADTLKPDKPSFKADTDKARHAV